MDSLHCCYITNTKSTVSSPHPLVLLAGAQAWKAYSICHGRVQLTGIVPLPRLDLSMALFSPTSATAIRGIVACPWCSIDSERAFEALVASSRFPDLVFILGARQSGRRVLSPLPRAPERRDWAASLMRAWEGLFWYQRECRLRRSHTHQTCCWQ